MSTARKMVMFPLTRLVLGWLCFALIGVSFLGIHYFITSPARGWLQSAEAAVAAVTALFVLVRFIERRPLTETGLTPRRMGRQLGLGFGLGAGMQLAAAGLFALVGWYRIQGRAPGLTLGLAVSLLAEFFFVAVFEEAFFRGLIFRVIEDGTGTVGALLVSALIFGFAHAHNPGATAFSSVAIALEAGLMLGLAYTWTRSLWLPIGIHWAWNLFEGPVLGMPVSGSNTPNGLVAKLQGPPLWTGGAFGPEAGLVCVGLGTLLGLYFFRQTRRAQHLRGRGGWRAAPLN